MNNKLANGSILDPFFTPIGLKDFAVSWVGPHPLQPGFCFGSEDGRLLLTNLHAKVTSGPFKASASGEAINGVAFSGEWLAVSTRADVTMRCFPRVAGVKAVVLPYGAHGVVAVQSGYFAAPMGHTGVMMLKAGSGPGDDVGVLSPVNNGMDFYQVIAMRGRGKKDLLVCATRQQGIGLTELRWGNPTYNMRIAAFEGIDVVDVCAVPSKSGSPAIAAVGLDGSLILVRDALRDPAPTNIKFKTIKGTAYRVLCRGEDLVVLTSRGLYVLEKLAHRLASGTQAENFTTQIFAVPMEAVDANIVRDRWLLVITSDEVFVGDLDLIRHARPKDSEISQTVNQARQTHDLPLSANILTAV